MRIAIIAALPGELKPLVKDWQQIRTGDRRTKKWTTSRGDNTWIAVCSGMGAEAARRAYANAVADGPLDMLFSLGWAGALAPEILPGTAQIPMVVIDAQTGERFSHSKSERRNALVTTVRVADSAEKIRLAATYPGALLVDMEGATVSRLAVMNGIPALCIKGISDAFDAKLPDLNPFINEDGQLSFVRLLPHLILRPRYWPSLIHLGTNSKHAAYAMRDLIMEFMKEGNVEQVIRAGSF
jgi:adenosylhomocysteine nucleosidase